MDNINRDDNPTNQIHLERDKALVCYLFICDGISFLGTESRGPLVFFKFSPNNKALQAIEKYYRKEAIPVQPRDLMDSLEKFKSEVFRLKGGI